MPVVRGKKYPYTPAGMAAAKKAAEKKIPAPAQRRNVGSPRSPRRR